MILCTDVQKRRTEFGIDSNLQPHKSPMANADQLPHVKTYGVTRRQMRPTSTDITRLRGGGEGG